MMPKIGLTMSLTHKAKGRVLSRLLLPASHCLDSLFGLPTRYALCFILTGTHPNKAYGLSAFPIGLLKGRRHVAEEASGILLVIPCSKVLFDYCKTSKGIWRRRERPREPFHQST